MSRLWRNKFPRAQIVFYQKTLFLLVVLVLLQGCQGGQIPLDVAIELPMQTKVGGQPYLLILEEKKNHIFNMNGFYEMEDLIPDLAFETDFSVAGKTYIVTSLFSQAGYVYPDIPGKKMYEYYLEIQDTALSLVDFTYIHRDTEADWSTVFDKHFSHLNQEGYCLLTFQDIESGIDCVVRGDYSLFCRSGGDAPKGNSRQALALTTARLLVGNSKYMEGAKSLTGPEGGEYFITARVVDWNLDGRFDHEDRVVFPSLETTQYYPLGEKITISALNLLISPLTEEVSKRKYLLDLSHPTSLGKKKVLKIKSVR